MMERDEKVAQPSLCPLRKSKLFNLQHMHKHNHHYSPIYYFIFKKRKSLYTIYYRSCSCFRKSPCQQLKNTHRPTSQVEKALVLHTSIQELYLDPIRKAYWLREFYSTQKEEEKKPEYVIMWSWTLLG